MTGQGINRRNFYAFSEGAFRLRKGLEGLLVPRNTQDGVQRWRLSLMLEHRTSRGVDMGVHKSERLQI